MAEEKPLQVVQWGSNYICEQIPSIKILPFISFIIYCFLLTYHMFISLTILRHM